MTDPQQEIFTAMKTGLEKLGYDVYDGFLPPEGTPYPFIYIGENSLHDEANKTAVFGRVNQTVSVWHDSPRKRGTVSAMLLDIKSTARHIQHTKGFSWMVTSVSQQIMPDTSTGAPLVHGVLDIEFMFS